MNDELQKLKHEVQKAVRDYIVAADLASAVEHQAGQLREDLALRQTERVSAEKKLNDFIKNAEQK